MACLSCPPSLSIPTCTSTVYTLDIPDCGLSSLVNNNDDTMTFTDSAGNQYILPLIEIVDLQFDDATGQLSLITEASTHTVEIHAGKVVSGSANYDTSVLTLVLDNGETVDIDMLPVNIYANAGTFDDATNTLTISRNDGVTFDIDLTDCCTGGGETGDETITTMTENADFSYTYESEDSTTTTIVPVAKRHTEVIPAGTTSISITHGLNNLNVMTEMISTSGATVHPNSIINLDTNTISVTFTPALVNNTKVVVL